jgi:hypothetical protein
MAGTFAYFQFLEKTIFNPPGCERLRFYPAISGRSDGTGTVHDLE